MAGAAAKEAEKTKKAAEHWVPLGELYFGR
jgi:hypothetical protein